MLQKLVTYGTFGTLFCGVEHTSKKGIASINGLLLKQRKNEFSIVDEFNVTTVADLKNHINIKQHLFLTINTEKVLFKAIDGEFDHQKAVTIAFPNLKIEEFFYESHISNDQTYIAICRKDVIESILKDYTANKFHVIGFSLGNLGISQLESFIETSSIQTSNSHVHFTNNTIATITISEVEQENYVINGLKIHNTSILSLTGILAYFMNSLSIHSNFADTATQLNSNHKQQRIFDVGLKIGLGVIFVSLLFSFMFFTHYSSKFEAIARSLAVNKSQKVSLLKLTDDVTKKEKILNDFSLNSSKSSWHLDQLGQLIPNSILLTALEWQPITKAIKEELQIETYERTILIQGITHKTSDFSQWIDALEQQEWIESVAINAFGNGKNRVPAFEILIVFKS